jgi:hypothetical protein
MQEEIRRGDAFDAGLGQAPGAAGKMRIGENCYQRAKNS